MSKYFVTVHYYNIDTFDEKDSYGFLVAESFKDAADKIIEDWGDDLLGYDIKEISFDGGNILNVPNDDELIAKIIKENDL